jgi:adenylate cyclase
MLPPSRPLPARPSLVQLFVVATLVISIAAGATFWEFLESSRRSIVERSEALRDAEARRIEARLASDLGVASGTLEDIERAMRFGTISAEDPAAVEARLFSALLDHPALSDVTVTRASLLGFDAAGGPQLAADDRWQVSVFRASADSSSEVVTRRISRRDGRFVAQIRWRPRGGSLLSAPFVAVTGPIDDPTAHPTFQVIASKASYGKLVPSDLHYSELDEALPQAERRIVLTMQKAVEDTPGHFVGVVRVGLFARTIDELPRLGGADGPERVFLCDPSGHLVARLHPDDRIEAMGDDLRVVPARAQPEIAAALVPPLHSGELRVGGTRYLATFRPIEHTQDWWVGVVVPEDYYTRDLRALRGRFLVAFPAVALIVLVVGDFVLRRLRRSLGRIVAATGRMRRFDFSPSPIDAPLRDVIGALESVERAKTSLRALGKYVPVDLVRQLYATNREPELGGELVELSILFTDIEGFTTLAERLAPDELARALGRYLETMTRAVHSTGGTIDKFIGDAVMAFWNAPVAQADHARRACGAVLACRKATAALFASSAWGGREPLFTRYGLHSARVMVGHFGAPDRLSYTALGDGVNLAARLEPLCKLYGVAVLASETIVEQAKDEFAFRLIDKVAVKGKKEPVRVYELLGEQGAPEVARITTQAYERALAAYFARDFVSAREILRALAGDPPSRVLAERCDAMIASPPPKDWNGVYVAKSK